MANVLRIKRTTTSNNPSSLANAELAFVEGDERLIIGKGTGGAGGSATSIINIGGTGAFFDKDTVQNANKVIAGPTTGSDAAPTFRALVAADIPSIAHTKISDFDTGVQANRLDQMANPTGSVSLNSQKITGLADPTGDNDAANKGYVDGVAQGLDVKQSVQACTTANITLSGTQTIDGVSVSADERVLVKDQSTGSQNGLYLCKSGSWVRTDDLAAGADAAGAFVFVEAGNANGDKGFVCTTNKGSATVGSDSLAFSQFSSSGEVTAGNGLNKSGSELSLDLKANSGVVISSSELALDLDASGIAGTLGIADGGTNAASAGDARTNLGLAIGSDVQAYNAKLAAIAGLSTTDGAIIVGNGSTFVLESGATARSSLGLAIGTNVQAYDAELAAIAGLTSAANKLPYFSGSETAALADFTAFARTLLDDANASAARTTLGVAIGSDVQAYDAQLADVAGLAVTDGGFIVGDGSNFVLETGSTARTSLGLAIGSDVQAYDAQLADIAGLAVTNGGFIVGDGSNFVLETGATARTSLGLGSMATQANDSVNIDGGTIDGITIDGGSYS